jgi:hypothetical protein
MNGGIFSLRIRDRIGVLGRARRCRSDCRLCRHGLAAAGVLMVGSMSERDLICIGWLLWNVETPNRRAWNTACRGWLWRPIIAEL